MLFAYKGSSISVKSSCIKASCIPSPPVTVIERLSSLMSRLYSRFSTACLKRYCNLFILLTLIFLFLLFSSFLVSSPPHDFISLSSSHSFIFSSFSIFLPSSSIFSRKALISSFFSLICLRRASNSSCSPSVIARFAEIMLSLIASILLRISVISSLILISSNILIFKLLYLLIGCVEEVLI